MSTNQFIASLFGDFLAQVPLILYLPLLASLGLVAVNAMSGERHLAWLGLKVLATIVAACLVFLGLALVFTIGMIAGDPGGSVNVLSQLFVGLSIVSYVLMLPAVIYAVFVRRVEK